MKLFPAMLLAVLIASPIPGCRQREKHKSRFADVDGGAPPDREEFIVQTLDCFNKCVKREASAGCIGCCRDQDYICDMQQKYSFEYCDGAMKTLSEATLKETFKSGVRDVPKTSPLLLLIAHSQEHYGNLVTYLRLKGLVPPSSEPPPAKK